VVPTVFRIPGQPLQEVGEVVQFPTDTHHGSVPVAQLDVPDVFGIAAPQPTRWR